jgi:hypothetical protein
MHGSLSFDHVEAATMAEEGAVGDEVAGIFDPRFGITDGARKLLRRTARWRTRRECVH